MEELHAHGNSVGHDHGNEQALLPAQPILEEPHELAPRDILAVCNGIRGPIAAAHLAGEVARTGEVSHVAEAEDPVSGPGNDGPAVLYPAEEPKARGPVIGTIILGVLPEIFRPLVDYRILLYMLMLLLMIRFQPGGLLGEESAMRRVLAPILKKRGA